MKNVLRDKADQEMEGWTDVFRIAKVKAAVGQVVLGGKRGARLGSEALEKDKQEELITHKNKKMANACTSQYDHLCEHK